MVQIPFLIPLIRMKQLRLPEVVKEEKLVFRRVLGVLGVAEEAVIMAHKAVHRLTK